MPEIYSDDDGARVIVRHQGPAGKGFPSGGTSGQILAKASNADFATTWVNPPNGTNAVVGPASAVDGHIALFNGTTGKVIKSAGVPLSTYASVSLVSTKQDKVTGKGLSTNDFTDTYKTQLDGLTQNFRGTFATQVAVTEIDDPQPGDYAVIEVTGEPQQVAFYDSVNEEWDFKIVEPMTGQEIADAIFDSADAAAWSAAECRIFTDAEKTQLAQQQTVLESLGIADLTSPFGSINYFNVTGTPLAITTISDGQTNMLKADVPTSFGASSFGFDAGTAPARLRYTGASPRTFNVTATISVNVLANSVCVFGIARNGAVDLTTRTLHGSSTSATTHTVVLSSQISLSLNDYLEVFVGNIASTDDVTIRALRINASPV